MSKNKQKSLGWNNNSALVLYLGLILSETQLLVNVGSYASLFSTPYFTLCYFILSTLYIAYLVVDYAFFTKKQSGARLQLCEHIILPVSTLLIVLINDNSNILAFTLVTILLYCTQGILIVIKIVYFGSVTPQFALISIISKLIRVVKLSLIAILPLIIKSQLTYIIIIASCQLVSTCAFFFKFTYQRCKFEYLLLAGVFCGMVSSLENVFSGIFEFQYIFIGQLISIYFYMTDKNYLKTLLELKYISNMQDCSENKSDDDYLASFLFMRQGIFPQVRTTALSNSSVNQATIQACIQIERLKTHILRQSQDHSLFQNQNILIEHIENSPKEIAKNLFNTIYGQFKNTNNYSCFEFLVNCALQLEGNFVNRALVIYYHHIQSLQVKNSIFEECKYQMLYQKILKSIKMHQSDLQQIKFIEFSQNLRNMNLQIENCINHEIKLIEYITDDDKKTELFADTKLFKRNELKQITRKTINKCLEKNMYVSSNEFKFLYILFHMCIEKRLEGTKDNLKKYFLSSTAKEMIMTQNQSNQIVLSGFNQGDIVNSNEIFKNNFGVTLNSFSRNNISEFIPTEKQRINHLLQMNKATTFQQANPKQHSDFECLLIFQKEFNSMKLKVIESYIITNRIYYQLRQGYNFICSLNKTQKYKGNQNLTLLKKDYDNFLSNGIIFNILKQYKVQQLDEKFQLCEVQLPIQFLSINNRSMAINDPDYEPEEKESNVEFYLEAKITVIEKRLFEKLQNTNAENYGWLNTLEMLFVASIAVFIISSFIYIDEAIYKLSYVVMNEQPAIVQAELIFNKVLIEQEILNFNSGTDQFPTQNCYENGITNITSYIIKEMLNDMQNKFDPALQMTTTIGNYGILTSNLNSKQASSSPYLINKQQSISFQKYFQLLKSQTFEMFEDIGLDKSNMDYYTNYLPSYLQNATIDRPNSLYTLMNNDQSNYEQDLFHTIGSLQAISAFFIGILIIGMAAIRLKDNLPLIKYLRVTQSINDGVLAKRMKELKFFLNEIHKIRASRIQSIDFDHNFVVSIISDKKTVKVPLRHFSQYQISRQSDFEIDSDLSHQQDKPLKNYYQKLPSKQLPSSNFWRVVIFQRYYLISIIISLTIIISLSLIILSKERNIMEVIDSCGAVNKEMSKIQQKYINLVAYDWLKILSLSIPINTTVINQMFNEAITELIKSDYQTIITDSYSMELSDQILFGNVCQFFNNNSACESYRNGIFNSGFSMLLPFTIKQHLQIDQISMNSSYFTSNLCDKTWLLIEGVIPMTTQIPSYALQMMYQSANSGFSANFVELSLAGGFLVFITLWSQYRRWKYEKIIRDQVLSLDTVSNLYAINEFKPYFNKIYYS